MIKGILSRWANLLILALALDFSSACSSINHSRSTVPEIIMQRGDKAPDFKLSAADGKRYALKDFRGKVLLLNFWASWCKVCVHELDSFERLNKKLSSQGLSVAAISIDEDPEAAKRIAKELELSFPVLFDKGGVSKARYGVKGLPITFLIDKQGYLVFVTDPRSQISSTRVEGPRNWTDPGLISQFEALLAAK